MGSQPGFLTGAIVESTIPERCGGTIDFLIGWNYPATMNGTLIMTPAMTPTRTVTQMADVTAVKKVVLLLGYPPDVKKKLEPVARKNRTDVRPPPRWGLND
jgi:hypothetical protein